MTASNLPPTVAPSENLSRYLLERSKFAAEANRVKYSAFMPAKTGAVSVFRTTELPDVEIWAIGGEHIEPKIRKSVLARAEFEAGIPIGCNLQVVPDEPPPRHANIVGWPSEPSAVRLRAMQLAEKATLIMR
jgi:hypothetical protein